MDHHIVIDFVIDDKKSLGSFFSNFLTAIKTCYVPKWALASSYSTKKPTNFAQFRLDERSSR